MRKVPVTLLQEGMVVGRPVFSAEGLILLNRGASLQKSFIQRLFDMGIPAVYVEDSFLPGELEVDDVISDKTRLTANRMIKQMMAGVEEQVKAGRQPHLQIAQTVKTIGSIVENLLQKGQIMVNLTDIRALDEYTFGHSVNVCVLALLTGIALGYSKNQLLELGMGALLHDLGKTAVPPEILNKPDKLTPEEYEQVKMHTVLGHEILRQAPDIPALSTLVSLQHHEKYDGTGYPSGLHGKDIHEYGRITGMVDVYDALTADRIYRKAYQPHEAFEMIAGSGNLLFEYRLVKAFLHNVALYPSGTLLLLHSGEIAVVLSTPKGYSHRPTVQVLYNRQRQRLVEPYQIKLSESNDVLVQRVLTEQEQLDLAREFALEKGVQPA